VAAAAALIALLALTGCSAPGAAVSDPRLAGTWHLASASDNGTGIPVGGDAITLTIGDSQHTGGDSPCSSYSATVTGGVGVVYIRAQLTGGTRDDCATPQLNSVEKHYIDALTRSEYANLDRGSLVLSSPRSHLVFVRSTTSSRGALRP
jgi:heat shock protein HslJ